VAAKFSIFFSDHMNSYFLNDNHPNRSYYIRHLGDIYKRLIKYFRDNIFMRSILATFFYSIVSVILGVYAKAFPMDGVAKRCRGVQHADTPPSLVAFDADASAGSVATKSAMGQKRTLLTEPFYVCFAPKDGVIGRPTCG
jgi:hypothetical protein